MGMLLLGMGGVVLTMLGIQYCCYLNHSRGAGL
jgi:hypothetical protein